MRLYNFRDIGGLPTKCNRTTEKGLLFRTANVTHLTEEEAEKLVRVHNVKTYVDFRGQKEVQGIGSPTALVAKNIEWINLTISAEDPDFEKIRKPDVQDWIRLYHRLFEKNMTVWERFFKILRDSEDPIAYGCLFGKDRTGIATSLILQTLNVDDAVIQKNYSQTTEHIAPVYEQFKFLWKDLPLNEEEIHHHFLKAQPEVIQGFLDYLRSHPEDSHVGQFVKMLNAETKQILQNKYLK